MSAVQPISRIRGPVLESWIDTVTWDQCLERVQAWARGRESRYVCACNVHSVVTAKAFPAFSGALDAADLAVPDGAPVAWCLRRMGFPGQQRINGPDLMAKCCELARDAGLAIYLYGSTETTLARLHARLSESFPGIRIVGCEAPPFRKLTAREEIATVRRISASGAHIVFVALGCPKQEMWMADHRGRIPAVMIGVGAAFDYHAGTLARAPRWMQSGGLEWLHRLATEPRRLWRRYLVTNSVFVACVARQLLTARRTESGR
jgi:N-acetylglucosaminyldiphosphoundecaprenol N-acetyl-beta-D-mannosaminyltransferase